MNYIICENITSTSGFKFVIFKTDSYEWSDWHSNLVQAIHAMRSKPSVHSCESIRNDSLTSISSEKHLRLYTIPELLPYSELLDQYPEIFI